MHGQISWKKERCRMLLVGSDTLSLSQSITMTRCMLRCRRLRWAALGLCCALQTQLQHRSLARAITLCEACCAQHLQHCSAPQLVLLSAHCFRMRHAPQLLTCVLAQLSHALRAHNHTTHAPLLLAPDSELVAALS